MADKEVKKVLEQVTDETPNDGTISGGEVKNILMNDGIMIKYGDMHMIVEQYKVDTMAKIVSTWEPEKKAFIRGSVQRELNVALGILSKSDDQSKEFFDELYADMVLWHILKES